MNLEEISKKIFEILSTQGESRYYFRGIFVAETQGEYQIRYVFSPSADQEGDSITLKTSVPIFTGKRAKIKSLGDVSSLAVLVEQEISAKFLIDFVGAASFKELTVLSVPRADADDQTGELIL